MKNMKAIVLVIAGLLPGLVLAELPGVLHWEVEQDLDPVYKKVYNSLEENRFFVVFEPNIGNNLADFSERWGDDYNRNQLLGIRSMVFCNGWYANQVSNLEPELLALCPLHVSLYQKDTLTHIVFTRPTYVGAGSKAQDLLKELEADVSAAIRQGIDAAME